MELEFLGAVGWRLYVAETDYHSWKKMLMGLVSAREGERGHRRRGAAWTDGTKREHHQLVRGRRLVPPPQPEFKGTSYSHPRRRSSSPPAVYSAPPRSSDRDSWMMNPYPTPPYNSGRAPSSVPYSRHSETFEDYDRVGFKRLPPSPPLAEPPLKKRWSTAGLSLQIPEFSTWNGSSANASPSEGFSSNFGRMSLASAGAMSANSSPRLMHHLPPLSRPAYSPNQSTSSSSPFHSHPHHHPHTSSNGNQVLVRPHAIDSPERRQVPQNLYFYTLSCSARPEAPAPSSASSSPVEAVKGRKGKLMYQPTSTGGKDVWSGGKAMVHPTITAPPTYAQSQRYWNGNGTNGGGYETMTPPSTAHPLHSQHRPQQQQQPQFRLPPISSFRTSPSSSSPAAYQLPHPTMYHHHQVQAGAFANNGPPGVMSALPPPPPLPLQYSTTWRD